jgi:hypothetical protein
LTTKMLASTVQFSNNHQNTDPSPRTLTDHPISSLLPDQRCVITTQETNTQPRVFSQDPTACRTPPEPPDQTRSIPSKLSRTRHPIALPISSALSQ